MKEPAGTREHRPGSRFPPLRWHQFHYHHHGRLSEVLTGGNAAWGSPKNFEGKSSNETQTISLRPLDFQKQQTPIAHPQHMVDCQPPRPPGNETSTYSTGSHTVFSCSRSCPPTDASSDKPCGNPWRKNPGSSTSQRGNSYRSSQQYNRHENDQYNEGLHGLELLVTLSEYYWIRKLRDFQGRHHRS